MDFVMQLLCMHFKIFTSALLQEYSHLLTTLQMSNPSPSKEKVMKYKYQGVFPVTLVTLKNDEIKNIEIKHVDMSMFVERN